MDNTIVSSMISALIEEYNDFSLLCAFNYSQGADEHTSEWNRARRTAARDHLNQLAELAGVYIDYNQTKRIFAGYELEYLTARIEEIAE